MSNIEAPVAHAPSPTPAPSTQEYAQTPLGMTLAAASRRVGRTYAAAIAGHGVTPPQLAVLRQLLNDDGLPLHEIGRRAILDPTSLTWLADQLEKAGLAERRRAGNDRRVIRLFVTDKGREIGESLMERVASIDNRVRQGIIDQHGLEALEAFEAILLGLMTGNSQTNT